MRVEDLSPRYFVINDLIFESISAFFIFESHPSTTFWPHHDLSRLTVKSCVCMCNFERRVFMNTPFLIFYLHLRFLLQNAALGYPMSWELEMQEQPRMQCM